MSLPASLETFLLDPFELPVQRQGETGVNFYSPRGELKEVVSYRLLRERAVDLAARLVASKLRRGDRVAIIAETNADFLIFFFVKFTYATQLGAWSEAHYGAFSRNVWGLTYHVLDLAFKFALPFLLWAGFYFNDLMAEIRPRE